MQQIYAKMSHISGLWMGDITAIGNKISWEIGYELGTR